MSVQVMKPFFHGLDPSLYPVVAAWYAEHGGLLRDVDGAYRALGSRDLKDRLRMEALLEPCRPYLDAYMERKSVDERQALEELRHYARFLREVKAQMGCAGRPLAERMRQDLADLMKAYQDLIRPEAVLAGYACRFDTKGVHIDGYGEPIVSASLMRFYTTRLKEREEDEYAHYEEEQPEFAAPNECRLFAATIGPGVDREVSRLSDSGESYQALILNAIGAGAADMVALDLELYLNREVSEEKIRWRRFHVGYGDFDLKEQRRLFDLLDPSCIGIELNPSCIMIPEKSVSGIMALKRSLQ
jgi:cobalamin-dependent methionine synthase I